MACRVARLNIRDLRKSVDELEKIPDKCFVFQAEAWTQLLSGMTVELSINEVAHMKCFVHSSKSSVGICKNCGRGVCMECAVDCGNGLSCEGSCEERVKRIDNFLDISVHRKINSTFFVQMSVGVIFAALGGYFYLGFNEKFMGLCFGLMGLVFTINALRHFNSRKKQKS